MNDRISTALAIAVGCATAIAVIVERHSSRPALVAGQSEVDKSATDKPADSAVELTPSVPPLAPDVKRPMLEQPSDQHSGVLAVQDQVANPASQKKQRRTESGTAQQPAPAPPQTGAPQHGRELVEPEARAALSFVGADAVAEQVWAGAINDPTVPPDERKDLIEDLNEDGFPDPKNVSADDLPLIVNRMALIEQIAPDAMDDVNAAAFLEAYKDLSNMLVRVTR